MFLREIEQAKGKRRVISTSKIRKITAIKKNRREKGSRADPLGSNPHSNGEFFSRSEIVFLAKVDETVMTIIEIISVIKANTDNKRITFLGGPSLLIGSQLYCLY